MSAPEAAVLRKSFPFFCMIAILCIGCAKKVATYNQASGLAASEGKLSPLPSYVRSELHTVAFGGVAGSGGRVLRNHSVRGALFERHQ